MDKASIFITPESKVSSGVILYIRFKMGLHIPYYNTGRQVPCLGKIQRCKTRHTHSFLVWTQFIDFAASHTSMSMNGSPASIHLEKFSRSVSLRSDGLLWLGSPAHGCIRCPENHTASWVAFSHMFHPQGFVFLLDLIHASEIPIIFYIPIQYFHGIDILRDGLVSPHQFRVARQNRKGVVRGAFLALHASDKIVQGVGFRHLVKARPQSGE